MLFIVKYITKHCIVVHFCQSKHVFIPVTKLLARWLHQKLNVVQLQKKQHVHEKEMQRQKLQQEKDLQDEELLARKLQEKLQDEELLARKLQEKLQDEELLARKLQEKLQEDLPHEEGDVNLLSFFSNFVKITLQYERKLFKRYTQTSITLKDIYKLMGLRLCKRCNKEFSTLTDEIYCSFECAYEKFGKQNSSFKIK